MTPRSVALVPPFRHRSQENVSQALQLELLTDALGPLDCRLKLNPVDSLLLLVRNVTLSRQTLYGVPEWVRSLDPTQLDLEPERVHLVNDGRLGRALVRLFDAGPRALTTPVVVHIGEEFSLDVSRCHQDSSSVTFSGVCADPAPPAGGGCASSTGTIRFDM